jgi:hypothetical protein
MQILPNMPTEFEVLRTLVDLQLELTASEQWNAASLVAQKIKNAMEPLEIAIRGIAMATANPQIVNGTPYMQPPFQVTCTGTGMTAPGADVVKKSKK